MPPIASLHGSPPRTATGARIFNAIGGLIFTLVSLVFLIGVGSGLLASFTQWTRPEVDCIVSGSEIVRLELPQGGFEARIHCRTDTGPYQGLSGTGTETDDDYRSLARLLRKHPPGSRLAARLGPDGQSLDVDLDPGWAWASLFLLPFVLMPAVFLIVGLDLLQSAMRNSVPILHRWRKPTRSGQGGFPWIALPFGTVFAVVGAVFVILAGIRPWVLHASSKDWRAIPAEVESSRIVTRKSGRKGSHRHAEILYRYEIDGAPHRSSRINPSGASGGTAEAALWVGRFPQGTRTTCLVHPTDPDSAFLDRTVTGTWVGLFGLPFLGVGLYVLSHVARGLRRPMRRI